MAEIFNFSTLKKRAIEVCVTKKFIKDKMTGRDILWRIFDKIATNLNLSERTQKSTFSYILKKFPKTMFFVPVTSFLTFLKFSRCAPQYIDPSVYLVCFYDILGSLSYITQVWFSRFSWWLNLQNLQINNIDDSVKKLG